jgi:Family of unknown function (DUF6176)
MKEAQVMHAIATAIPLLPGKSEEWRRWIQELEGSCHAEYVAALRRWGISHARFWISEGGGSEVVIAYFEMQDPDALTDVLETSQHPFDVWYRWKLQEFHGLDVRQMRRRRLDPVLVWPEQPDMGSGSDITSS